ncbi:MAG: hypothetical protein K0R50_68 [Eubacterium sp.]|jgi:hypothetical protein|nr:hypothetical protein [Eubacterium sp.]
MSYFDRTRKMSNILIGISIVAFLISAKLFLADGVVDQIFEFSNGNFVKVGILHSIFFLISLFSLIMGIALKCIVKDAKEELDSIKNEFNEKLK